MTQVQPDPLEERNTERMNFRTKPHIKRAIQRAAALTGVDDSAFTMRAAYERALETIAAREHTLLKPEDHQGFFDVLDNPPPAPERLKAAYRHYRRADDHC